MTAVGSVDFHSRRQQSAKLNDSTAYIIRSSSPAAISGCGGGWISLVNLPPDLKQESGGQGG